MKQIKAIVRKERIQDVVAALRAAGVPRLTLSHVHALGSGVDPEDYRLSFEEGTAYTEKTRLELVCRADELPRLIEILCCHARTGQRGDGVIFVTDVEQVVKIRSGNRDQQALV